MQAEPIRDLAKLVLGGLVEYSVVHAVVGHVDPGRVRAEHPHQLVPGRLGGDDEPGGAAGGGSDRGLVERRGQRVVGIRLGEERQVVHGHHDGCAGPQRHRVMRRVDHVRAHLLCHQRQAALLPGQPGGPVRDGRRAGHDPRAGHEAPVSLLVGALARHGQVRSCCAQGADQPVNVTAERATVRRHSGRVNKHTRPHDRFGSSHQACQGHGQRSAGELCSGCPVRTERTPSRAAACPCGDAAMRIDQTKPLPAAFHTASRHHGDRQRLWAGRR